MKITFILGMLLPAVALAQTPAATPAAPAPAPQVAAPPATTAAPAPKKTDVVAPPAKAQKGRFLVAPKFGLFEPTSRLSGAFFAGIEAGYLTPALDDHLAVVLEVDWVRPRASGAVADPRVVAGDGAYNLGNAEVGVLFSAVYRFEDIVLGLTPYGGLGPGFFFHRTATQAFQNTYVETEGRLAFQMMAGADYTLGPGAAFVEFRYHFSKVDFLATGNTNVGGFLALGLGYRLRF
jgi:hypothetical protein